MKCYDDDVLKDYVCDVNLNVICVVFVIFAFSSGDNGYGRTAPCSTFNFIDGLIFYNITDFDTGVLSIIDLVTRNGGANATNIAAYNASFAAASSKYRGSTAAYMDSASWRENAYAFCRSSSYGNCSVIAVNAYGNGVLDLALSPYIYLLENGSCSDSFTMSAQTFANMEDTPPTALTERYYQCTLTQFSAMVNAVGIASGTAGTMVPASIMLMLPLLYLWMRVSGHVQPKQEYTKDETQATTELIALNVLRARDGKTRNLRKRGVFVSVSDELMYALTHDAGYADSDDEDSDEGEGDGDGDDGDAASASASASSSAADASRKKDRRKKTMWQKKSLARQEEIREERARQREQRRAVADRSANRQSGHSGNGSGNGSGSGGSPPLPSPLSSQSQSPHQSQSSGAHSSRRMSNSSLLFLNRVRLDARTANPIAQEDVEMGPIRRR